MATNSHTSARVTGRTGPSTSPKGGTAIPLLIAVLLLAALLTSIVLAVGLGPSSAGPNEAIRILINRLTPWSPSMDEISPGTRTIVWQLRTPRVLLGAITGAGLATVGVVIQAILRNPIADPYIIGVSSGAALGAVSVIVLAGGALGPFGTAIGAFAGACIAFATVFVFAWRGGLLNPLRLVLAGVAIAAMLSSFTTFVVLYGGDDRIRGALHWTMGSFTAARWQHVAISAPIVLVALGWFMLQGRTLNALAYGEETAITLGIRVNRFRLLAIILCALVTGVLVSMSGPIGFVALILPHITRLIVGGDHRKVLPIAAITGACFVIWADVVARMLIPPTELPIGVITAAIGAPIFLILLPTRTQLGNTQ